MGVGVGGVFFRCYPRKLESLFKDKRVFFIAVSNALTEGAIKRGVPENRCVVRHTGCNQRYFVPPSPPASRSNKVLFVGRLSEFRGCEFLLREQRPSHRSRSLTPNFLSFAMVLTNQNSCRCQETKKPATPSFVPRRSP
jgi:hypothetical protein